MSLCRPLKPVTSSRLLKTKRKDKSSRKDCRIVVFLQPLLQEGGNRTINIVFGKKKKGPTWSNGKRVVGEAAAPFHGPANGGSGADERDATREKSR